MNTVQNRQGDVLLVQANAPVQGRRIAAKRIVIEVGEATGHEHVLMGDVALYQLPEPVSVPGYKGVTSIQMVVVKGVAQFAHLVGDTPTTEHDPIEVKEGVYFRLAQYEYQPGEVRRIAD